MATANENPPIRMAGADGAPTYLIDLPPEAMPPVRPHDLAAALPTPATRRPAPGAVP